MARKKINLGRTLSESEMRDFLQMREAFRREPKNSPRDQPGFIESIPPETTEFYIARTPRGGIPALSEDPSTGTGIEDTPGSANCKIYRIIKDENGDWLIKPYTTQEPGFFRRVFNLCDHSLMGQRWIRIVQEKSGAWVSMEACRQVDAPGTGTGTGTTGDECSSVTTYETDTRCEDGSLNVYRRESILDIVDGCLTQEYGEWEFWHEAGCCGTHTIDIADINNYFDYREGCVYFNEHDGTINININNTWYVFCPCDEVTGTGTGYVGDPTGTGVYTGTGTEGGSDPTDVVCVRVEGSGIGSDACDCSALNADFDLVNNVDTPSGTSKTWISATFDFCGTTLVWQLTWTQGVGGTLVLKTLSGTVWGKWEAAGWGGTTDAFFTYTPAGTLLGMCTWPATLLVSIGPCSQNTGTGTEPPDDPPVQDCFVTECCDTTPPTWTAVTSSDNLTYDNLVFSMTYADGVWTAQGLPAVLADVFTVYCVSGAWFVQNWTSTTLAFPNVQTHQCDPDDFFIILLAYTLSDATPVLITLFGECDSLDQTFTGTGFGPCDDCPTVPRNLVGTFETTPAWPDLDAASLNFVRNAAECQWLQPAKAIRLEGANHTYQDNVLLTPDVDPTCDGELPGIPWQLRSTANHPGIVENLSNIACLTWTYLDHECTDDSFMVRFTFNYDRSIVGGSGTGTGILTITPAN